MAAIVCAQTQVDLRTQSKGVDFQAAPYTKPLKSGAALPITCGVNEAFFLTTAPAGSNIYTCNSANTWSLQGGIVFMGGDVTGTSASSVVQKLQTRSLSPAAPLIGQVLVWDGSFWTSQTISVLAGDVSGPINGALVTGLQNRAISSNAPQVGQALVWNGSSWGGQTLPGVLGTISVENSNTLIGTRGVENFIAGSGLVNIITDSGVSIDVQQNADTAILLSRATYQSGQSALCKPSSGSGSVYSCAMSPTLTSYQQGMVLQWQPDVAGTGGVTTLQIDSLGAKPVKLADGAQNPQASDIVAGRQYSIWFDGANFRIEQSPDTMVLLTRATYQSGQSALCKPSGGSGSVYSCAMTPTLTSYQQGMVLQWQPDVSSAGGATTLQIDSLGAKPVKLADGIQDPQVGDLAGGQQYSIWFDGTNFRLMAPPLPITGTATARPTCDVGHRGRIWQIFAGASVKDDISVCAKDATNAYAWRVLY